jgi:hypothetical protein
LDSAYAEALQVHVAKLVTTPAAGTDADAYLSNIATQTLQLLLYGLFKNDKVCCVSFFYTLRRNRRMQSVRGNRE